MLKWDLLLSFPHKIRASKRTREDARKGKETLQRIISYNLLGGCNFLNGLESAVLKDVQCLTLIDTASSNWAIICTRSRERGGEGQGCETVFIVLSHPLILISCNLIVEYRYLLSFFWSSQQVLNSLMLFAWSYLSVCHMCSCDYSERRSIVALVLWIGAVSRLGGCPRRLSSDIERKMQLIWNQHYCIWIDPMSRPSAFHFNWDVWPADQGTV